MERSEERKGDRGEREKEMKGKEGRKKGRGGRMWKFRNINRFRTSL